ncbi:MAG: Unknown protein [uncultured Campylobacterales bacterium]|uniref:Cytochrome C oxidase subunit IV n=1 Tax=uncultured Campylobacterales bacterium TaxID=352960 RepID=A0A6S6SZU5_9BACT|nr:MAG: Unknown protein [uncultured Campylobacterales bacterium]
MSQNTDKINSGMYLKMFILLLVLTTITLLQPYIVPLELAGTLSVQLFISFIKAYLIIMYYMHIKFESSLFKGFLFMLIISVILIFGLILPDMIYRESVNDAFNIWSTK